MNPSIEHYLIEGREATANKKNFIQFLLPTYC